MLNKKKPKRRGGARLFSWLLLGPFFILLLSLVALGLVLTSVTHKASLISAMQDQAMLNQINYEFKLQVQEWKNFLLRSHIEKQHEYYWSRFVLQEEKVRELGVQFRQQVESPFLNSALENFMKKHKALGDQYKNSKQAFIKDSYNLETADQIVRGIDRGPSNEIVRSIELADELIVRESAKANAISSTTGALSIGLVFLVGLWVGACTIVGVSRTMKIESQEKSKFLTLACTDPVTRLNNRFALEQKFEDLLVKSHNNSVSYQVIYLDLDNLKQVNDRYGHKMGDGLLQAFSKRLTEIVSDDDFVARIGGDEFVILRVCGNQNIAADKFVNHLEENSSVEYAIGDIKLAASASIGSSMFPNDGLVLRSLLRRADEQMYAVKQQKRVDRVQATMPQEEAVT